jgi:hypothetical protein
MRTLKGILGLRKRAKKGHSWERQRLRPQWRTYSGSLWIAEQCARLPGLELVHIHEASRKQLLREQAKVGGHTEGI